MFFERPFIIISFSSRHRVHLRFPFLPAGICLTMAHLIENCRFSFFRFQTCLDNSVSCLYFSLRRDFKWFLYLVLKSLAVTPMHVCLALSSVVVTSALWTTLFVKHFPSVGQFSRCRQLQSFSSSLLSLSEFSVSVCFFRMVLLCLSKKDFMLSVQL